MSDQSDSEKAKTLAALVAQWWERAKVTVMGVSILVAVLSTTWVLSGSQSQIAAQITDVGEAVVELKAAFAGLDSAHETTTAITSGHDTRIGRLEEWRDTIRPDLLLVKQRLMTLERAGRPALETPP